MFDNSPDVKTNQPTQYIKPLSSQQPKMQLPTAVAYHRNGMLVTCDYQGKVRTFKYLDQDLGYQETKQDMSSTVEAKRYRQHKTLEQQQELETIC